MVSERELRTLLLDLESDRIERTTSTDNTDKFCEAICAFANDMPGHGVPGYLIIGADDKTGKVTGVTVTDQLLQKLSNYADSGQISPFPTLTVQKMMLAEGNVVVVEVLPSDMPPLRYRGRVWIRRGPRKAIANEQEERILSERRAHHARSFDLQPCRGCDSDALALDLFYLTYRTAALAPEIIAENNRDLFFQMASLGFWDSAGSCATNAGAILFSEDPLRWFPGAYVQYVRYDGDSLDADIDDERKFSGDLLTLLRDLDGFLKTAFSSHPVAVSPLKEEQRSPYPMSAMRELIMNAVMHRDYQANSPIRFYRFNGHIEIQNPGGLYGTVTRETFPNQNDYRNPKIAEAMKVLGYVNTFGRGIARAQRLLKENGNPPAEFGVDEPAYFLATIKGVIQ